MKTYLIPINAQSIVYLLYLIWGIALSGKTLQSVRVVPYNLLI